MSSEVPPTRIYSDRRTWLKDRLAHPYLHRYWPGVLAMDRLSRSELLSLRDQRLAGLIVHAVEHVPFYRRWFADSGFRSPKSVGLDDLPIVTKNEYRARLDDFQSDAYPAGELVANKTSGSSGEPFRFRRHPASLDYSYACMWRSLLRHGIRLGDRRGRVWGRSYQFNSTPAAIRRVKRRHAVRDWMNNSVGVDAYSLTLENVGEAVARLRAARPVYLHGYVSALYVIARHLADSGQDFGDLRLKAVVTESEKLYPFQKAAMEAAFQCPVLEFYGSVELGAIAQTDPHGDLLVNDDMYIVETLPAGEAVVTDLFSRAYPFLRYRLGDVVTLAPGSAQGLPYTVLEQVVGRTLDLIPLRNGGYIHGMALAHVLDHHLALIHKYQVHQKALNRFVIRVVTGSPLPEAVQERIISDMMGLVGPGVDISVREVDHIAPAQSGKFRWILSDVPHQLATR
jgi:phenylacetate-CoA ligase